MTLIQVNSERESLSRRPTRRRSTTTSPMSPCQSRKRSCAALRGQIFEDVLGAEWEIGGLAMPTDAIRGLVADE